MSTTVTITGGTAPEVTVGDAGASVSVPSVAGVLSLNSLAGAVTLAVVGGTISAAGNTLTITVTGGGGASSWTDLTGKPFTTIGTGLSVSGAGVLSATGLAIADTTGLQAALDLKAPLASPTFTGTVSGVTKAMVGLGSVENVADASKPVSTAQAAADAAVQAYAIQRANHTGTQAVGTITGLGSLATQSGTFSGTSSGTNTGDQTATTVSVAGGYTSFTPASLNVESALSAISGALENKADSSPATTVTLGPIRVGTGLGIASGTLSVSYGTSGTTACVGNDARLSDARTPTAHTQAWSTITATPTTLTGYGITDAASSTHTHGNLTNAGAIGSTSGQIVVTTTSGVLTTAATIAASAVTGLATVATSGAYADLSGKPTIPTITSGTAAPSGGSSGDIYLRYS